MINQLNHEIMTHVSSVPLLFNLTIFSHGAIIHGDGSVLYRSNNQPITILPSVCIKLDFFPSNVDEVIL